MAVDLLGGGQTDVLIRVLSFLNPKDVAQCSAGSRSLSRASNHSSIWLQHCEILYAATHMRTNSNTIEFRDTLSRTDDAAPKQAYIKAYIQAKRVLEQERLVLDQRNNLPDNDVLEVDSICVLA
jgi:hypothetical protein